MSATVSEDAALDSPTSALLLSMESPSPNGGKAPQVKHRVRSRPGASPLLRLLTPNHGASSSSSSLATVGTRWDGELRPNLLDKATPGETSESVLLRMAIDANDLRSRSRSASDGIADGMGSPSYGSMLEEGCGKEDSAAPLLGGTRQEKAREQDVGDDTCIACSVCTVS